MSYVRRLVDDELDELVKALPAIALDGAKGVGKTATAQLRANSSFELDSAPRRELVKADPRIILSATDPVLIDEWQRVPEIWDVVRRAVDESRIPGRFLLTSSASPTADASMHSGAGRIFTLRMRPMSFHERHLSESSVSFRELLSGEKAPVYGSSTVRLADYLEEICASGFPGIRLDPPAFRQQQLDSYLERIFDYDLPALGHQVRQPGTLRAWLTAYAAATSTTTDYQRILEAATPGESDKPAKTTTLIYRDLLTRLWLLDPIPGWVPSRSPLTRLRQGPKHQLADPALAAALLGVTPEALLGGKASWYADQTLAGALFESLVALSVRVLAQHAGAKVYHLRTYGGDNEIDLIVEKRDGSVLAMETKLAATVSNNDVRQLAWLQDQLGPRLLDRVVVNTGDDAYRRADGVAVVPLALLGP